MWEMWARDVGARGGSDVGDRPSETSRARLRLVVVPVRHRRRLLDLGARHAPRAGLDLLDLARLAARLVGVVVLVEAERHLRRRRHRLELRVGEQLVDARQQRGDAVAARRRDGDDALVARRRRELAEEIVLLRGHLGLVELVEDDDLRLVGELGREELELGVHRLQVAHRVGRRAVDDVRDEPAALNVAEEGAAEADALVGALEEPRDVGEDHAVARRARLLARVPDAEVGRDGGERVVGHLGLRARRRREQRRFAGVRAADEADVGEELELEQQPPLGAGLAHLREPRRRVARRLERGVAAAAAAAARDAQRLAVRHELAHQPPALLVADDGARRHADGAVAPALAVPRLAHPALPFRRAEVHLLPQRVQPLVALEDDGAAAPAVAAARPHLRLVLLAAEGDAAVAAVARGDVDPRAVEEEPVLVEAGVAEDGGYFLLLLVALGVKVLLA